MTETGDYFAIWGCGILSWNNISRTTKYYLFICATDAYTIALLRFLLLYFFYPPVRLPLTHNVRHMAKAVTRHRKPMHIIKQKLLALTEYIPPKPLAPPGALTPRARPVQEVRS